MAAWRLTAVAAVVAAASSAAQAAVVEAGTVTSVYANAPMYDTSLGSDGGCDPAGCVDELTRDGDLVTLQSRWSCKPELSDDYSLCTITYTLGETFVIDSINIALYKGDERTRTLDIYVEGEIYTTWTSSGTTTGFENVELGGQAGATIELVGDLTQSEWLSISEVEIMVETTTPTPAPTQLVEAPATIVASSDLWDTRLSDEGGCDPAGCVPSNTRDGGYTDDSRWSCAPYLGGEGAECSIHFDVGAEYQLAQLKLAFYKGTERTRTIDIYVDGYQVADYTSLGNTEGLETIDITGGSTTGTSGQVITVTGVLEDDEWLSIFEAEVWIYYSGDLVRKLLA